ncbi:MAG: protease HtpX [Burkholderiales bacterium]
MKRVFLFILTNLAVMLVLSITARLLGLDRMMGGGMGGLLVFCAFMGFGGAFISLAMSKWTAKRMTGAQVLDNPTDPTGAWLVETVRRQATQAGIGMPEVAVYDSPDINAFATGMSRNNALVAVSTGLLTRLSRDEVEAVLGHEVAHVANGDMVTLTLIQGVVNTFVFFLARIVGQVIDRVVFKSENGQGIGYYVSVFVAEMVLGVLASVIVMWFSRQREFRADTGGAQLSSRPKMIAALDALRRAHEPAPLPSQLAAMGISGGAGKLGRLFMTHPPLEERIEALRAAR